MIYWRKKKVRTIIFDYERATKSKVWQSVDDRIWVLELMELYKGLPYEYFTETLSLELFELMKQKLIADRKRQNKT